jgi:hypothetical protein
MAFETGEFGVPFCFLRFFFRGFTRNGARKETTFSLLLLEKTIGRFWLGNIRVLFAWGLGGDPGIQWLRVLKRGRERETCRFC